MSHHVREVCASLRFLFSIRTNAKLKISECFPMRSSPEGICTTARANSERQRNPDVEAQLVSPAQPKFMDK